MNVLQQTGKYVQRTLYTRIKSKFICVTFALMKIVEHVQFQQIEDKIKTVAIQNIHAIHVCLYVVQ